MARTVGTGRRRDQSDPRPAWEVVALAAVGAAIALYLTVTKLTQATPLLCGEAGSCEIVQASRYATLLGLPTALWGAGLYIALGVLAARPLTRRRWLWSFGVAAAGAAFSVYLTGLSLLVLRAACGWCLASTAVVLAVVGTLLWRRPAPSPRWPSLQAGRLAGLGGLVAVATVAAAAFVFSATGPGSDYQQALARHLSDTGARFYGAHWCPACREQKRLFGGAAATLPYVECDPGGTGAQPELCAQASVRSYPTWTILGTRREGVLPLETLATLSNFTPTAGSR